MKNLDTIVIEAKEKINNIAKSYQIVPPIPDTTSQTQPVVAHAERITLENMVIKIVDECHDRESCKLNLIFHNVLAESSAAQQSERVSSLLQISQRTLESRSLTLLMRFIFR